VLVLRTHGETGEGEAATEATICIFSHTRPAAKKFLRQIKLELELNHELKALYPDVLWEDPAKEAPKWSEDDGLIVKRKSNPKEATLEAWGIIDGQPTGVRFEVLVYDDVITEKTVTTPEQIEKATESWALSLNLAPEGAVYRYIGTRYHFFDTYRTIMDRGAA
jgi:hypothetical protein